MQQVASWLANYVTEKESHINVLGTANIIYVTMIFVLTLHLSYSLARLLDVHKRKHR